MTANELLVLNLEEVRRRSLKVWKDIPLDRMHWKPDKRLLDLIRSYSSDELSTKTIDRSDKGYVRTIGDFVLRMAYHESVHTGQLLSYMRRMNVPRPEIWD
jgi:uncharacterized damage-inducible protein DinB